MVVIVMIVVVCKDLNWPLTKFQLLHSNVSHCGEEEDRPVTSTILSIEVIDEKM